MTIGRPTLYNDEIVSKICELISEGKSLTAICAEEENPGYRTVMRWLEEKEDFRQKYARACEARSDLLAEECLTLADQATDPQKARLQFDARRWYLSKLVPKKYGDKVDLNHSGGVTVEVIRFSDAGKAS